MLRPCNFCKYGFEAETHKQRFCSDFCKNSFVVSLLIWSRTIQSHKLSYENWIKQYTLKYAADN